MVMKPDVLSAAIEAVVVAGSAEDSAVAARRAVLSGARARQLAAGPGVLLVCGRFEGVDERVIEAHALEEISVGDFVLSGGEIAAMAVMDCCVRLLPGVMGEPASASEESFEDGLLEYPHYTRPAIVDRARRDRTARAGGPGLGPPRQGRRVADEAAGRDYAAAAARSMGPAPDRDGNEEK